MVDLIISFFLAMEMGMGMVSVDGVVLRIDLVGN